MQRYPKCFQKDKTDVKIVDCTEGILEKFKIDNSTLLGEKQSDSARPRIDVEQAIKRIKDFSILNGAFPMKMVNLLKNIFIHTYTYKHRNFKYKYTFDIYIDVRVSA